MLRAFGRIQAFLTTLRSFISITILAPKKGTFTKLRSTDIYAAWKQRYSCSKEKRFPKSERFGTVTDVTMFLERAACLVRFVGSTLTRLKCVQIVAHYKKAAIRP